MKIRYAIVALMLTSSMSRAADVKISALPSASALIGNEKMAGVQGAGCATSTSPCSTVAITPAQIKTYVSTSPSFTWPSASITKVASRFVAISFPR